MNYSAVNKREKSLAELVIVIALLFILMASFIHYFFKNQPELNNVGFNNMANNFASQVVIIHSQWLMSGRPAQLTLTEITASSLKEQLNTSQQSGMYAATTSIKNKTVNKPQKIGDKIVVDPLITDPLITDPVITSSLINKADNKRVIKLNKKGWIINDTNKQLLACQQVWQQVMDTEMIVGKKPISALLIQQKASLVKSKNRENSNINHKNNKSFVCRFIITTGQFFDYHSSNGRVNMSN